MPDSRLRELTQVQRQALLFGIAVRSAIVTTLFAVYAVASGNLDDAVPLAVGAFFAAIADTGEVVGQRWRTMLWTTGWLTFAALAGGFSADSTAVLIVVAAAVAFGGGYAGALGPRGAVIGLLAVVTFNAFAIPAESTAGVVHAAVMVAIGALAQTLVTVARVLVTQPRRMFVHQDKAPVVARLKAHWVRRDLFRLHASRLAVAIALGVLIDRLDHLPHSNWIPIVIAWVTVPDRHGTVTKVMARIIGTLAGAVVMWVVGDLLDLHGYEVAVLIGIGAFIAVWLLRANYSLAVVGITMFMLGLFELLGQSIESLIRNRILDTLIAGAIVVIVGVIGTTLFPARAPEPATT